MYIDTHAHLDFPAFREDFREVLDRFQKAGVEKVMNVGVDIESSKRYVEMAKEYEFLYAAVGIHPSESHLLSDENVMSDENFAVLENLALEKKVVAIGEIGLDYFEREAQGVSKSLQQKAFRKQLNLAKSLGLPVIVHCRDAYEDALKILLEERILDDANEFQRIVFHCFTGPLSFAQTLWNLGIFTSFTGIVTYPNAKELHTVVKEVPLDRFMVETDCPFLAPQSHRGKRNEPAFVPEVVAKIAELKGVSLHEVSEQALKNSQLFFHI